MRGPPGPCLMGREMSDRRGGLLGGADQAALMGAGLAAIIASVVSPGRFGWLSTAFGVMVLSVLAAYYRPEPARSRLRALAMASALGVITALGFTLAVGWPVQQLISARETEMICGQVAIEGIAPTPLPQFHGDFPGEIRNVSPSSATSYEDCVGNRTAGKLPGVWLVTAVVVALLALVKWHRPVLLETYGRLRRRTSPPEPALLRKVTVTVRVPDLDRGLAFYSQALGHRLRWQSDDATEAGLALPESDTEIVLATSQDYRPNWLVESADAAAERVRAAGGTVVSELADTSVGRMAVVADPFENVLVLIDLQKGRSTTASPARSPAAPAPGSATGAG